MHVHLRSEPSLKQCETRLNVQTLLHATIINMYCDSQTYSSSPSWMQMYDEERFHSSMPHLPENGVNADSIPQFWKCPLGKYFQVFTDVGGKYICAPNHTKFTNKEVLRIVGAGRHDQQLSFINARLIPGNLTNYSQPMEEFFYKCAMDANECNWSWVHTPI